MRTQETHIVRCKTTTQQQPNLPVYMRIVLQFLSAYSSDEALNWRPARVHTGLGVCVKIGERERALQRQPRKLLPQRVQDHRRR
jgi:hypothetical protein